MRPRRARVAVALSGALAGVLLGSLAGCGEPTTEDYCEQLRTSRQQIADIAASGDPQDLLDNLALLRGLRDQAPRDVRDEWDTFLDALDGLALALDRADLEASDFVDGEPPDGLPEAERRAVLTAAERVQAPDVVAAASGIETQARDVCRVNLGL